MYKLYKKAKQLLLSNPIEFVKLSEKNKKLNHLAKTLWPVDVGIEIEAPHGFDTWKEAEKDSKENIPHLLEVNHDNAEMRFRFPAGIKGFIALYHTSKWLNENAHFNLTSGIHYHIDAREMKWVSTIGNYGFGESDHYYYLNSNGWVMNALKHWNYTGSFNKMTVSSNKTAVRLHYPYKTVEIRIGEMTFDYELLVKRIMNSHNIVQKMKKDHAFLYIAEGNINKMNEIKKKREYNRKML